MSSHYSLGESTVVSVAIFGEILNSRNLPEIYPKLSDIFIFDKILKLQIFVKMLKIVETFLKYSIFRPDIFAKLLCEILTKLLVPQH